MDYLQRIADAATINKYVTAFVADLNTEVVGCVIVETTHKYDGDLNASNNDAAHIRMLYVAPEHRRCGIGEALALKCIKFAQVSGYSCATLNSNDITGAISMYKRLGFEPFPEIDIDDDKYPFYGYILRFSES